MYGPWRQVGASLRKLLSTRAAGSPPFPASFKTARTASTSDGSCFARKHGSGGTHSPPGPSHDEIIAQLNSLLDVERATAGRVGVVLEHTETGMPVDTLIDIAVDHGRFCAMLTHHMTRFGNPAAQLHRVSPIASTRRQETLANHYFFIQYGQILSSRLIKELIEQCDDMALRSDLEAMLRCHAKNLRLCLAHRPTEAFAEHRQFR